MASYYQNSNRKKLLGFRNMQEKLEKKTCLHDRSDFDNTKRKKLEL